jgi:hypothetical protein
MPITIPNISFNFEEAAKQLPPSVQKEKSNLRNVLLEVNNRWELVKRYLKQYNDIIDKAKTELLVPSKEKEDRLKKIGEGVLLDIKIIMRDLQQISMNNTQNQLCNVLINCVDLIPYLKDWIKAAEGLIESLFEDNAETIVLPGKQPEQTLIQNSQKVREFGENYFQYLQDLEKAIHKIKDDCVNVMLGLLKQQQTQGEITILPEYFAALHNYISESKDKTQMKMLNSLLWMSAPSEDELSISSGNDNSGILEKTLQGYLFVPECLSQLCEKASSLPASPPTSKNFQSFLLLEASFLIAEIRMILRSCKKKENPYEAVSDKVSSFLKAVIKVREHITKLQKERECISSWHWLFKRKTNQAFDQWLGQLVAYEVTLLESGFKELKDVIEYITFDEKNADYGKLKIPTPGAVDALRGSLQQIKERIGLIPQLYDKLKVLESTGDALNHNIDVTGQWADLFVQGKKVKDNKFFGDRKIRRVAGIVTIVPDNGAVDDSVNTVLSYEKNDKRREAVLVVKKVLLGEWTSESENPLEELKQKIGPLFDFRVDNEEKPEEKRKELVDEFINHLIENYVYFSVKDINTTAFRLLAACNEELSTQWLNGHKSQAINALKYWDGILSQQLPFARRDNNSVNISEHKNQYYSLENVNWEDAEDAFLAICALSNDKEEDNCFKKLKRKFHEYVEKNQRNLAEHFKDYRHFIAGTFDPTLSIPYFAAVFNELVTRQIETPIDQGRNELKEFANYLKGIHQEDKKSLPQELINKLIGVLKKKVTDNRKIPWLRGLQDIINDFRTYELSNPEQLQQLDQLQQEYQLYWLQWMLKDTEFAEHEENILLAKKAVADLKSFYGAENYANVLNLIDAFLKSSELKDHTTALGIAHGHLTQLDKAACGLQIRGIQHQCRERIQSIDAQQSVKQIAEELILNLENEEVNVTIEKIRGEFSAFHDDIKTHKKVICCFIDKLDQYLQKFKERIGTALKLPEEYINIWKTLDEEERKLTYKTPEISVTKLITEEWDSPFAKNRQGIPIIKKNELYVPKDLEKLPTTKPFLPKWLAPGRNFQHELVVEASDVVAHINEALQQCNREVNSNANVVVNSYEIVLTRITSLLQAVESLKTHEGDLQKKQKGISGWFRRLVTRGANNRLIQWLGKITGYKVDLLKRSFAELEFAIEEMQKAINDDKNLPTSEQIKDLSDSLETICNQVKSSSEEVKDQLDKDLPVTIIKDSLNKKLEQLQEIVTKKRDFSESKQIIANKIKGLQRPTALFVEEIEKKIFSGQTHGQQVAAFINNMLALSMLTDEEKDAIRFLEEILTGKAYYPKDAILIDKIAPLFEHDPAMEFVLLLKKYVDDKKESAAKDLIEKLKKSVIAEPKVDDVIKTIGVHFTGLKDYTKSPLIASMDKKIILCFIEELDEHLQKQTQQGQSNKLIQLPSTVVLDVMNKLYEEANKLGESNQMNDAAINAAITQSKQEIVEKFKNGKMLGFQKTLSDYIERYVKHCETNSELDTVYADFILLAGNDDIIDQYGTALINHAFKRHAFNNVFSKKEFIGNHTIQKRLVERLLNEKQWQHELEPPVMAITDLGNLYKVLDHFAKVTWKAGTFSLFLDNIIKQYPEFKKFRHAYNFTLFRWMSINPKFAKDNKKLLEASDQKALGDIYGPRLDDLKEYIKSLFKERRPINRSVFKLIENYQRFGLTDENIIQPMENEARAKFWIDIFKDNFTQAKIDLEDLKSRYYDQVAKANDSAAKGILEKIVLNLQLFTYKVAAPSFPEEQARNQQRLARVKFILPVLSDIDGVKEPEVKISECNQQLNYQFESEEHLELYDHFQRELKKFDKNLLDTIYMIYPEYKEVKTIEGSLKSLHDQLVKPNNDDKSLLNVITASFDLHELLNNMGKKGQQETVADTGWQIMEKNAELVELAKNLPKKAQKIRELVMHEDGLGYFADVYHRPFIYDTKYYGNTIADYEQLKETSEEEIKSGQGSPKNKYNNAIARFNLGECRSALADLKDLEFNYPIIKDNLTYHQAVAKAHYRLEHDALEQLKTLKGYAPALRYVAYVSRVFADRTNQQLKNDSNNNKLKPIKNHLSNAQVAYENAIEIYKNFLKLKYLEEDGSKLHHNGVLLKGLFSTGLMKSSQLGLLLTYICEVQFELIKVMNCRLCYSDQDLVKIVVGFNETLEKQLRKFNKKTLDDLGDKCKKDYLEWTETNKKFKNYEAKVYHYLGSEKMKNNQYEDAITHYKRGLETVPKDMDPATIQLRIDLHRARAKAHTYTDMSRRIENMKQEGLQNVINVRALAIDDYTKAIELLEQLPKYDKEDYTDCWNELAKSFQVQGDTYEKLGQICRVSSDDATKCFEYSKYCYNLANETLPQQDNEKDSESGTVIVNCKESLFSKSKAIAGLAEKGNTPTGTDREHYNNIK